MAHYTVKEIAGPFSDSSLAVEVEATQNSGV